MEIPGNGLENIQQLDALFSANVLFTLSNYKHGVIARKPPFLAFSVTSGNHATKFFLPVVISML